MNEIKFLLQLSLILAALAKEYALEKCGKDIHKDLSATFKKKNAMILPLGRAYIAGSYGVALKVNASILSDHILEDNKDAALVYAVTICAVSKTFVTEKNGINTSSSACNVSLWGRYIGPEILPAEISFIPGKIPQLSTSRMVTSGMNMCSWSVKFPAPQIPGSYKFEVLAIWVNSLLDPDMNRRGVHTANDGNVVHLGGIGTLRNRSWEPPNTMDIRLNDGDPERAAAHVFGSPFRVIVTGQPAPTTISTSLPLCKTGEEEGRWVQNKDCGRFNFTSIPIGHECWQTDMAYQGLGFPAPVNSQQPDMVWRPYNCQLRHFTTNSSSSITPTAQCFIDAGIGVFVGFGDSLGYEQRNNLELLLGGRTWSGTSTKSNSNTSSNISENSSSNDNSSSNSSSTNYNGNGIRNVIRKGIRNVNSTTSSSGTKKGWLECDHWKFDHWLDDYSNLAKCVERQAKALLKQKSSLKTIIFFTNFNIHHGQWKLTLEQSISHLHKQRTVYQELQDKLQKWGITLKCIWFSGVAIHGFRVPGLTPSRQESFNSYAKLILGTQGGWMILDAYRITFARPDGTTDGIHYRGGVSKAITTVLVNMICN